MLGLIRTHLELDKVFFGCELIFITKLNYFLCGKNVGFHHFANIMGIISDVLKFSLVNFTDALSIKAYAWAFYSMFSSLFNVLTYIL